ncbi:MAG: hypothetical protein RXN90_04255, partial [Thermoproteus sp.]
MVLLTVAVATLGAYDVLWLMLGTVYSQLSFMWGLVVLVLILFTLLYTARRLDKAAEVKGPYQDWGDKLLIPPISQNRPVDPLGGVVGGHLHPRQKRVDHPYPRRLLI